MARQRYWFTADLHLGHRGILSHSRRIKLGMNAQEIKMLAADPTFRVSDTTLASHDSLILDAINRRVAPHDKLFILGDFCMCPANDYVDRARRYRQRIVCEEVHLILGNHDRLGLAELFNSAETMKTLIVGPHRVVTCHYAMATWEHSHRGAWHLYGHSHGNAEQALNRLFPGRKSMDVGIDNIFRLTGEYRPLELREIREILDKRVGHSIDHHDLAGDRCSEFDE